MATRATITVRLNSKVRLSVYLHWDGYPQHALEVLKESYNTKAKALELVSYGSISSLGSKLHPSGYHSFENREDDVTTFYGRDRGENDTECLILRNSEKINREEYNYFFNNGEWNVI